MPRRLAIVLLSLAAVLASPVLVSGIELASLSSPEGLWRFRVLLDGREIGYHEFHVSSAGKKTRVESTAQFDVKFLFFTAYEYEHRNTESWRDGCLSEIEASTDDNGTLRRVSGNRDGSGFVVETNEGRSTYDRDCVRTFSYWNPAFLNEDRLLNAQTGELVDVRILANGADTVTVGEREVPALHFTIRMKKGEIELWYGRETGQWLALESPARGGRLLRYEPVNLPLPLGEEGRIAAR